MSTMATSGAQPAHALERGVPVADRGHDVAAQVVEHRADPGPDDQGIVGDHHADGRATSNPRSVAVHEPPTASARSMACSGRRTTWSISTVICAPSTADDDQRGGRWGRRRRSPRPRRRTWPTGPMEGPARRGRCRVSSPAHSAERQRHQCVVEPAHRRGSPDGCRGRGRGAARARPAPARWPTRRHAPSPRRPRPAPLAPPSELERQRQQPLLGSVVQVTLEVSTLAVAGVDDAPPRALQLGDAAVQLQRQALVVDRQPALANRGGG